MDVYLSLQILNLCLFFHKAAAVYVNLVWSLKVPGLLRFSVFSFHHQSSQNEKMLKICATWVEWSMCSIEIELPVYVSICVLRWLASFQAMLSGLFMMKQMHSCIESG